MELISRLLRTDFREFCSLNFVLRNIDDMFAIAGIKKGTSSPDLPISGQRRGLVEDYYASVNWHKQQDADRFLVALSYALTRSYYPDPELPRKALRQLIEREGLMIDGINVRFNHSKVGANTQVNIDIACLSDLKGRLLELANVDPTNRGFLFEKFLGVLFEAYDLSPRGSFRLVGEQIDGSFQLNNDVYLLEAKWQAKLTSQSDLLVFREKVESKSAWSRGLFVSYSGFTEDGITAFARGRATNIIGMTGQDLYYLLNGGMTLVDAVSRKARTAAETGEFYTPVYDLLTP
jgi:hypothetical protein